MNSTPTVKDSCRIEFEYLKSDQRKFFIPCPHCAEFQYLKFRQLKWEDEDPKTARYECEHCNQRFEEYHKTKVLAAGEWRATAPGDGETRGYHISALYSPLGWKSWPSIVREFLDSKADAPKLKAFVNSILGETFEEEYAAKVGAEGLKARAETYPANAAPRGVLVLVAGTDVQDNRLSISIYGFGRGEEQWLVSRVEIYGDPGRPEIWKQHDEVILRKYPHELGGEIGVTAACIDSGGHYTQEVYQYVREKKKLAPKIFILAIKGQSQKGKVTIGKPTKVDINFKGQVMKSGADLYPVGSDTIKSVIYGRFKHNEPGEGYIHFHADLPDDFWKQITSEKLATRWVKGFPVREWSKKNGERNEALDEICYAYAAMQFLYTRYVRATIWDQLERKLNFPTKIEVATGDVNFNKEVADQGGVEENRAAVKADNSRGTMAFNRRRGGFGTRF